MTATLVVVALVFAGLYYTALRMLAVERASHERKLTQVAEFYVGFYAAEAQRQQEGHDREIARITALYEKMIERTTVSAESAIRLATTGVAQRVEAKIEEREPDATERASRAVTEQTIETGVQRLREEYRNMGVAISDDDLREEVEALMLGIAPAWSEPPGPGLGVPRD